MPGAAGMFSFLKNLSSQSQILNQNISVLLLRTSKAGPYNQYQNYIPRSGRAKLAPTISVPLSLFPYSLNELFKDTTRLNTNFSLVVCLGSTLK